MLMSWAASGVVETTRAATEAATVCTRTRRPQNDFISWFCLVDGLADLPSPVRECRRWRCPLLLWGPAAEVLRRPDAPYAARAAGTEVAEPEARLLPRLR